ncbi:MAG: PHP domain-containing protein [Lentisphaeria bacterium]
MIDLHSHSTASDGTFSPKDIVVTALYKGLKAIALTDHDTVDGLEEFLTTGEKYKDKIETIPGIELSCVNEHGINFHIVGLFIQQNTPELQSLIQKVCVWRDERNHEICEKLIECGIPISWEEIQAECPGNVVGRPHIAAVLIRKGYCNNNQHAFRKYIGRGRPGYVSRRCPLPEVSIAAIHAAGGLAIWAHPYTRGRLTNVKCKELTAELQTQGLDGIEAYYTMHTPTQINSVLKIADELGLLVSGGSDFHGSRMPDISLGTGMGTLCVPNILLQNIKKKLKSTLPLLK